MYVPYNNLRIHAHDLKLMGIVDLCKCTINCGINQWKLLVIELKLELN